MIAADESFPSDYWVAIATVIPVFLLVIAVQGPTYEKMVATSLRYLRSALLPKKSSIKQLVALVISPVIMGIAICLIIMPAASEGMALVALGSGSDNVNERSFAMSSAVLLLIAVIIPPLILPIKSQINLYREIKLSIKPAGESPSHIDSAEQEQGGGKNKPSLTSNECKSDAECCSPGQGGE